MANGDGDSKGYGPSGNRRIRQREFRMRLRDIFAVVVTVAAVIGLFYIDRFDSGSCYWIAIVLYLISRT